MSDERLALALENNSITKSIMLILDQIKRKEGLGNVQVIELLTSPPKNSKDRLLVTVFSLIDELKEEHSCSIEEVISSLTSFLVKKYRISKKVFFKKDIKNIFIPVEVFNTPAGSLESLVRYLHDDERITFCEIAKILKRDQRTIWSAYHQSLKHAKQKTTSINPATTIPLSIFSSRKLTIFESATIFLRNEGLRYSTIASLLNKDQRNVWSTYHRALTKISKGGKK